MKLSYVWSKILLLFGVPQDNLRLEAGSKAFLKNFVWAIRMFTKMIFRALKKVWQDFHLWDDSRPHFLGIYRTHAGALLVNYNNLALKKGDAMLNETNSFCELKNAQKLFLCWISSMLKFLENVHREFQRSFFPRKWPFDFSVPFLVNFW